MPLYLYRCPACGRHETIRTPVAARDDLRSCPSPEHFGEAQPAYLSRLLAAPLVSIKAADRAAG
jgi:putative FmdB family regulatory protein